MNYKQILRFLLTISILLCALTNAWAQDTQQPESILAGEDVILHWNRILRETVAIPGQNVPTIYPARTHAMMHAAMFDAVNSIDGTYTLI